MLPSPVTIAYYSVFKPLAIQRSPQPSLSIVPAQTHSSPVAPVLPFFFSDSSHTGRFSSPFPSFRPSTVNSERSSSPLTPCPAILTRNCKIHAKGETLSPFPATLALPAFNYCVFYYLRTIGGRVVLLRNTSAQLSSVNQTVRLRSIVASLLPYFSASFPSNFALRSLSATIWSLPSCPGGPR
jgi:hypothetical protein